MSLQSVSAAHAVFCATHSFVYAPDMVLVQSVQNAYAPLLLDELDDELAIPLLLEDDPLPPPPPSPLDELELLDAPDELLELLVPFVVLVPVSSVHPPKTRSAHEVTKTPTAQS
jgi:hypothetical protein